MDFSYQIEKKTTHAIISLKGMMMDKAHSAPMMTEVETLVKNNTNRFIINLAGMDYMNSSGLNTLVNILTKARTKGGEVIVSNISEKVRQLFLITKLNTLFTITESIDEAEKIINS
jgi:anti-sigma B factor antagonist